MALFFAIERFIYQFVTASQFYAKYECGAMLCLPLLLLLLAAACCCAQSAEQKVSDRGETYAHCRVQQHSCHPNQTYSFTFLGNFFTFFFQTKQQKRSSKRVKKIS